MKLKENHIFVLKKSDSLNDLIEPTHIRNDFQILDWFHIFLKRTPLIGMIVVKRCNVDDSYRF